MDSPLNINMSMGVRHRWNILGPNNPNNPNNTGKRVFSIKYLRLIDSDGTWCTKLVPVPVYPSTCDTFVSCVPVFLCICAMMYHCNAIPLYVKNTTSDVRVRTRSAVCPLYIQRVSLPDCPDSLDSASSAADSRSMYVDQYVVLGCISFVPGSYLSRTCAVPDLLIGRRHHSCFVPGGWKISTT